MASIKIRVGAALDASVGSVFPRFEESAKRSGQRIRTEQERAAQRAAKEVEKAERQKQSIRERSATMAGQYAKKTADEEIRQAQRAANETQRALAKSLRQQEREETASKRRQSRVMLGMAQGFTGIGLGGGSIGRFVGGLFGRAMSFPGRLALDIARGAGVQMDAGTMVQSFVGRQKLATDIVNSGFVRGAAGAQGIRQSPAEILAETTAVGKATATDPTKALEGLQKFVAITGDLETGRAVLADMAKLSRATGSELDLVVTAAGDLSSKLGDIPDKAGVIRDTMAVMAGMGKLGAIEMRDLAGQMSKIAALAPRFAGNRATNVREMGILMQEARQGGGAASADVAATSVASFVNLFSKGSRNKAYEKLTGHSARDATGNLAAPESLILEILRASMDKKGNLVEGKIAGVVADTRARKATMGFENIFRAAGGGQKGLDAVAGEFDRLRKATMDQADVDAAFNASMQTSEAKVQQFNDMLQESADKVLTAVLPALSEFGPMLASAAGDLAKAFVDLTPLISKFANFINPEGGTPGKTEAERLIKATNADALLAGVETGRKKDINPELITKAKESEAALQPDYEALEKRVQQERAVVPISLGGTNSALSPNGIGVQENAAKLRDDEKQLASTRDLLESLHTRIGAAVEAAMTSKTLSVEVTNFPKPGGAPVTADPSGRQPVAR